MPKSSGKLRRRQLCLAPIPVHACNNPVHAAQVERAVHGVMGYAFGPQLTVVEHGHQLGLGRGSGVGAQVRGHRIGPLVDRSVAEGPPSIQIVGAAQGRDLFQEPDRRGPISHAGVQGCRGKPQRRVTRRQLQGFLVALQRSVQILGLLCLAGLLQVQQNPSGMGSPGIGRRLRRRRLRRRRRRGFRHGLVRTTHRKNQDDDQPQGEASALAHVDLQVSGSLELPLII